MTTYSGLLVRDNFQDVGTVPTTGNIWRSPDIIPYGANTLSGSYAASTYGGPDIGAPFSSNNNNNIYVRSKNIAAAAGTGYVNLYYADASLFLYPSTWVAVSLPQTSNNFITTDGTGSTTIPANAIALVQAPFTLGALSSTTHYCFIAAVSNNGTQFPLPASFDSNADFGIWVANSPNVSYRNIVFGATAVANVVSYMTFGNANSIASSMNFSVVGTNVPANSTWSASCADSRLDPTPFSASGTFSSSGTASTQLSVPANIDAGNALMSMAFTFTAPNNQPFPSDTTFQISYYQVPTTADVEEVDDAFRAREREASAEHRIASSTSADGFEVATLILLGSVLVLVGQN